MKKRKTFSIQLLLSLIFGIIGAAFLIAGTLIWIFMDAILEHAYVRGDISILPKAFLTIGIIFLFVVLVLSLLNNLEGKKKKYLLESGRVIYAHVDSIDLNSFVEVNRKHPFVIKCSYTDPATGEIHSFKSENYFGDLSYFVDKDVRVFIDGNDYSYYVMDIDETKIK